MSKKQNQKDPTGFIFDVQSNTVMAQGGTFENMKEKISAVRAVVPNRSNNEIILVLQHFDNCVDKTVQAFMEGNASEVLKEWTITSKKKSPPSVRPQPEQRNASKSLFRSTASNQTSASLSPAMLEDVPVSSSNKKLGSNIEKSVKDLQRCTVSLARYRVVVKEEMDASIKKMKQVFAELQSCLMDREVALLAEMDKVKAEAMEILVSRQKKAGALKKMTDVAVRMSEEQLVELRADIKHFVSERKYDEDLGRVARFTCDLDAVKKSISSFGQVSHPKNSYSTRSRCSSVMSSSPSDPSTPECASAPSLPTASRKPPSLAETPAAGASASSRPCQPHREVFQGNRKQGQGYRPQGQRHNGPSNPGRHDSTNRYRNGPWYQSSSKSQNPPFRPPGIAADPSQTHSTGTSGTGAASLASQPVPSAQVHPGAPTTDIKGLPQRKPRPSQPEEVNS
ncbi:spermatogenesis-associated serine-rich protein 2 isoform X9 [Dermochelys coriacea]|uniref:spermatogenesis-associated serine-rich protein 2 isoform X9 n=1 Tax=Dermochelys coriacea TaxID=27794 RepID=UPI001CA96B76|nr:spermatogenesis-associated serine-rich protein 2 isoform X9 [Dermochelys coriacea]